MADNLPEENGKAKSPEEKPLIFTEKMLDGDFDEIYRQYPLEDDSKCGYGFIQGKFMQM